MSKHVLDFGASAHLSEFVLHLLLFELAVAD
jgi:hypothetical protein